MTFYGLIASLAWTACAVLLIFRGEKHIARYLDAQLRGTEPPTEVPDDLLAVAMAETEEWAQAQTLKVIREKYDEYGDWNRVRSAIGVATVHKVA